MNYRVNCTGHGGSQRVAKALHIVCGSVPLLRLICLEWAPVPAALHTCLSFRIEVVKFRSALSFHLQIDAKCTSHFNHSLVTRVRNKLVRSRSKHREPCILSPRCGIIFFQLRGGFRVCTFLNVCQAENNHLIGNPRT